MSATPYSHSGSSKKIQIEKMFNHISPYYDFLNHLLSLNIDKLWRNRAIAQLSAFQPRTILDIATGTADFAIAATRIKPQKITGIDLSEGMLKIGRQKIKKKKLSHIITLTKGDSEAIPFDDNSFDAAIVGFGIRNFENHGKALLEIFRVLKPNGAFIVLEFSHPRKRPFSDIYFFYFNKVLPWVGRIISKNKRAYYYLSESVREFPEGEDFINTLNSKGFQNCKWLPQTLGIASVYISQKPK